MKNRYLRRLLRVLVAFRRRSLLQITSCSVCLFVGKCLEEEVTSTAFSGDYWSILSRVAAFSTVFSVTSVKAFLERVTLER